MLNEIWEVKTVSFGGKTYVSIQDAQRINQDWQKASREYREKTDKKIKDLEDQLGEDRCELNLALYKVKILKKALTKYADHGFWYGGNHRYDRTKEKDIEFIEYADDDYFWMAGKLARKALKKASKAKKYLEKEVE